jgi:hypothetical protein
MSRFSFAGFFVLILGSSVSHGSTATVPCAQQESVSEWVAKLKSGADHAKLEWLDRLVEEHSEESLKGLIEVFDAMESIYMRRAVMRALARFDDVPDLGRMALDKLTNIATGDRVRQVRWMAVDTIARCHNFGRHYLRTIVDSPATPEVRELAMEHLVGAPHDADFNWYMSHFRPPASEKPPRKSKKDAKKEPQGAKLGKLRALAFDVVAPKLELDDVIRALRDRNREIRVRTLAELEAREEDSVLDVAERFYANTQERGEDRLIGAELLVRHRGAEIAARLAKDGGRKDTPFEMARGLAQLLTQFDDPKVEKLLLKLVGKGKGQELLFSYWATAHIEHKKVSKALQRGLKNKDPRIVIEAARILGQRGDEEALPNIERQLEKARDASVFVELCLAIGEFRKNDAEWQARLGELARNDAVEIRNGAIEALGRLKNKAYLPLFIESFDLETWSTRLAAAKALAAIGTPDCVAALCKQAANESGRLAAEMGRLLFELTGGPYGENGKLWAAWWEREGADFKPISPAELRQRQREEEGRKLRRTTVANFFGIEIESHNLVFVVDISGSMEELTEGEVAGKKALSRMAVAKRELVQCLDGIDRQSFFNILAFSDRVTPWSEEIRSLDGESLAEAKHYVQGLRSGGGTNLYGALRTAFDDAEVDTIFLISDGEPSLGAVTDPGAIRDHVARWNANRGIRIHSIAIGPDLRVLEWLARDSGGLYFELR